MSKPLDKVQLVKQESTAGGGNPLDNDELYVESPLDPTEDAPEVQGVFFQDVTDPNDEEVYVTRNGDDMVFADKTTGIETTLSGLALDERVKVSPNDTTASYLISKLVAGDSITIAELNDGSNETLEISADVAEIFSVQEIEKQVAAATTSSGPVDAMDGESLNPPADGDYLVIFESDARVTNNNGTMRIGVALNGTSTIRSSSIRHYEGNSRGSVITVHRLNELVVADTVHGVFSKESGSGTAQLFSRSFTLMRIA